MDELHTTTGAIESPRDYRDIPFDMVAGASELPKKHIEDLSMLPIWYQKKNGSCVGHAGAKYAQHLNRLETGDVEDLSARFLYAIAKSRDNVSGEGTYPRLVAKIVKDHGVSTEATVPNASELDHETYVYFRKEKNIPAASFTEAKPYRSGGYAFVNFKDKEALKRAIIEGHGVLLTVHLGKEWYTDKKGKRSWAAKDILPLRVPAVIISGHAIFLYGYEDESSGRTKFYIRNSWSEKWGDKGDGYFYFEEYGAFIKDAITFVDIPNDTLETVHELPNAQTFSHTFNRDIEAGERSDEVKALQTALMIDGQFDRDLYSKLLKSNELGYFKPLGVTQDALYRYQIMHKVASLAEINALKGKRAGAKTRAILNAQF